MRFGQTSGSLGRYFLRASYYIYIIRTYYARTYLWYTYRYMHINVSQCRSREWNFKLVLIVLSAWLCNMFRSHASEKTSPVGVVYSHCKILGRESEMTDIILRIYYCYYYSTTTSITTSINIILSRLQNFHKIIVSSCSFFFFIFIFIFIYIQIALNIYIQFERSSKRSS